jgi:signal transduction histidine kinase
MTAPYITHATFVEASAVPGGFAVAAAELDRRRNVYLATVAHEMRNALAPLSTAVDVLARCAGEADGVAGLLPVARRQIDRLSALTADLLDLGRAVNDEFNMSFADESVQSLVGGVVTAWRVLAQAKHQTMGIDLPAAPVLIRADKLRFSQALENIVGNAVKFTPEGGHIGVRVHTTATDVRICVSDTGIGISPSDLGGIFELFNRVRRDGPAAGGFGIGLALTRKLVELHGGSISARSDGPGQGLVVTISLPLLRYAQAA